MKMLQKKRLVRRKSSAAKRAIAEREIHAGLQDHPSIVRLEYAFQTKQCLHLVLEYIDGGTLEDLLDRMPHGCLDESATRFGVAEILLGLEFLHEHNIIYRDLKPENIREWGFALDCEHAVLVCLCVSDYQHSPWRLLHNVRFRRFCR